MRVLTHSPCFIPQPMSPSLDRKLDHVLTSLKVILVASHCPQKPSVPCLQVLPSLALATSPISIPPTRSLPLIVCQLQFPCGASALSLLSAQTAHRPHTCLVHSLTSFRSQLRRLPSIPSPLTLSTWPVCCLFISLLPISPLGMRQGKRCI